MTQTSETPRLTAVPAKRSSSAVLRVRLFLVLGLLGFAALMGVISTFAWLANAPEAPNTSLYQSQARGAAEAVAYDWLNGRPIQIGRASNLEAEDLSTRGEDAEGNETLTFPYTSISWDGYSTSTLTDGASFEIHRFLVTSPTPPAEEAETTEPTVSTYELSVTMLLTQDNPVLGAAPSIAPYVPNNSEYPFDYSEVAPEATPSEQAVTVMEGWAQAYATNDTQQLALIVADPNNGVYEGIPGFTAADLTVVYATPSGEDNLLVRARVSLTSANGFTSVAEYDLLVAQAATNAPHVVAWGAAGAGNGADFLPYTFNRRPI